MTSDDSRGPDDRFLIKVLPGWRTEGTGERTVVSCSLVLATRHRPERIVGLLGRLAGFDGVPAEIVVVDGSDGDGTQRAVGEFCRGRRLPYALTYVQSSAGLTRQRNVGVDISTGEILFFLDDDSVPQPGYFHALQEVLDAPENSNVGGVCGAVVNEMNRPLSWRWRIRIALGLVPKGEPGKYYSTATSLPRSLARPFSGIRPIEVLPGCAMVFRRAVFSNDRFSEFFTGYAQGEDVEMSRRIARGWALLECGDAHVVHDHAETGRPLGFVRGRMSVRNRTFIWQRHNADVGIGDRVRYWLDNVFSSVYYAVVFLRRPRQIHNLTYAFGVIVGVAECLVAPPRYVEPPARREYEADLKPLDEGAV